MLNDVVIKFVASFDELRQLPFLYCHLIDEQ